MSLASVGWLTSAVLLFLSSCAGVPTAPAPEAPSASPSGAPTVQTSPGTQGKERLPVAFLPPREPDTFGAVESFRQTDSELMLIYRVGENPYNQRFGLGGGHYMVVGGKEYAIHWDSAPAFATMAIGDTYNLHPTDQIMVIETRETFPKAYRLMKAYKGSKRVRPLLPVRQ